ncbi:hypothetical protein PCANC_11906 [Puccinia coronata f. sp. avenae]|uniref:Uncharacterized protein n=1 Tax=Puccinia coronata f. sp. avenae TaxID=200324 RepID=A0A2N5V5Z2_9BASI|nr:hypothetical protein PCASD_18233 [Puccinia coronata f. sp. avenae]PLW14913.1 hypothetical protein PCANC_14774 [Puccinia coronata f. sp. avenae]PLW43065.1 hypothetical protein PCASD_06080 [Puccinia coronata f. sp. avenae]PLW45405.1 hypothetical protein PCANC_11906 [Puccinia coronata f. sp. avenae]
MLSPSALPPYILPAHHSPVQVIRISPQPSFCRPLTFHTTSYPAPSYRRQEIFDKSQTRFHVILGLRIIIRFTSMPFGEYLAKLLHATGSMT